MPNVTDTFKTIIINQLKTCFEVSYKKQEEQLATAVFGQLYINPIADSGFLLLYFSGHPLIIRLTMGKTRQR